VAAVLRATSACSRPVLERNFQLARDYIDCFDGYDDPYTTLCSMTSPRACGQLTPRSALRNARSVDA